jgi:hypothetical protein
MSVSIVSSVSSLNLAAIAIARNEVAEKSGASASSERNYALTLNDSFVPDWFSYEANDLTDDGKQVKAEKELFYKALHAAHHNGKHPNPSTVWARVRKYGSEAFFGIDDAPTESGAKHGKSPDVRIVDTLVPLYKFLKRQDSLSDKQSQVLTHVSSALTAFGMDLSMIDSGK